MLTASTDNKYRTNTLTAIQFQNTIGNVFGNIFHSVFRYLCNILFCYLNFASKYVLKRNTLLTLTGSFYVLCSLKVCQILLSNRLRHFIAGKRNHAKCNNTSIFYNRNITCSGSDIHKRNVQKAEFFRNCHVNRSNWLKRQTCHMQSCKLNSRIQAIHNLFRQKSCNQLYLDVICHMHLNHFHRVAIQIIFYNRIADTEKLLSTVGLLFSYFIISLFHPHHIQRTNMVFRHLCL